MRGLLSRSDMANGRSLRRWNTSTFPIIWTWSVARAVRSKSSVRSAFWEVDHCSTLVPSRASSAPSAPRLIHAAMTTAVVVGHALVAACPVIATMTTARTDPTSALHPATKALIQMISAAAGRRTDHRTGLRNSGAPTVTRTAPPKTPAGQSISPTRPARGAGCWGLRRPVHQQTSSARPGGPIPVASRRSSRPRPARTPV